MLKKFTICALYAHRPKMELVELHKVVYYVSIWVKENFWEPKKLSVYVFMNKRVGVTFEDDIFGAW